MATKKGDSPKETAPTHRGAISYSSEANPRKGSCTQVSAGGLASKFPVDNEKGTGSAQR